MLAFSINSSLTEAAVLESNSYYGGWSPEGSRIIFVNGVIDPWRALSIQKSLPTFPALLVAGARFVCSIPCLNASSLSQCRFSNLRVQSSCVDPPTAVR
jgi:hypothetical protein